MELKLERSKSNQSLAINCAWHRSEHPNGHFEFGTGRQTIALMGYTLARSLAKDAWKT
ncbi:hypothetical protein RchiOBHm_Chr4g0440171 [Rosa chinensis]|uniref:Uncharacterized protein n=1 Tax=Rosa chinensis TaxID=74649 RepID=A0A2P6R307_ROSCH|nr:hypothetical protein RchiOBHm_Chr4g0440171 [Rosa chinensis]